MSIILTSPEIILILQIMAIIGFIFLASYKLALYFFLAFLALAITGLYGGIAGILNATGFETIPLFGNKILEIYEGLALLALGLFFVGLIKS